MSIFELGKNVTMIDHVQDDETDFKSQSTDHLIKVLVGRNSAEISELVKQRQAT